MSTDTQQVNLKALADLPSFVPFFTEEDGFAAVYPELFADPGLGLMKVEGFGPLKLAVFRNRHLRSLMIHPALTGNTPAAMLAQQAFYSAQADDGKEDEVRHHAAILARYLQNQIFTLNPPLHRAYRNVLGRHLMGSNIERYAPIMRGIVKDLLDSVVNRGRIDFVDDFAGLVAARFWGVLIDLTAQEEKRIVELMHGIVPMFNILMSQGDLEMAGQAMGEYMSIVSDAVERALERGNNDLLNTIAADFTAVTSSVQAPADELPESVGMLVASNLFDGFHTAGVGAANCVYRLLSNPDSLERLRHEPSLIASAASEGLRLDPPLTLSQRYALEDFLFEGVLIPKGTQVVMMWGAGNRDPEVYAGPDVYDLSRSPRGATTFGGGTRMCMGRGVAQLLIESVIEAVTAPGVEIERVGEHYSLLPMSLMRQFAAMPVAIKRAQ
ncbi:cytochrome P450 [Pseudomonas sp. NCHU5208]|uniref:cytochrome P450 n=1 Tax=unclassified Pseudomonas TaxID=196821 RepID=UPI003F976669